MNKQQIKSILDNAPEGATHISSNGVFYSVSSIDGYTSLTWWVRGEEWIDTGVHHITQSLSDLRTQLALIEENEKLKARVLDAENILYQLVEERGLYCSDFGNLLPPEDQDSEVIRKAVGFMNSHIQELKGLSND